jgi:hypothetical protein
MFNTYDSTRPYDNQMGYSEDVLDRFWSKVKFECNEDGTINNNACMIWTAYKDYWGYGDFSLSHINSKNKKSKRMPAHKFSWQCYNGPVPIYEFPDRLVVRHKICHNPACVNPLHLEIGTDQQNVADMVNDGRQAKGSKNGRAELSDEEVFEILKLSKSGITQQKIADRFGVTRGAISKIVIGRTWSELTGIIYDSNNCNTKGVNNGMSKLNNNTIREIRQKLKLGRTGTSLAREYSISDSIISNIKNYKTYK